MYHFYITTFFQMITLAFDWGQKLMKTRIFAWCQANLLFILAWRYPKPDDLAQHLYVPLLHNYFFSDDHTRVRLRSKADEDKDDYLNANFVDGFRQPRAYIATQGPIQGTFPAFWKMVWEQNTQVIVMITHLFENGKVCCNFQIKYLGIYLFYTHWIF